MKTKVITPRTLIFLIALSVTILNACKKEKIEQPDPASMRQLAKDEIVVEDAMNEVLSDVNDYLSGNSSKQINALPCNATIDSSSIVNDTITYTVTFNGLNCAGTRHRQGTALVKKHINTHWYDVDATVIVTYVSLKVTKVSTGNWVILNGTKTYKNVSGGLVIQLGNGTVTSVAHQISGNMDATFEDNTTRTWQIARNRTFTGTPGQLEFAHEGFGNAGGYSNLVVWGVNRDGENFYTQISQDIVFKQQCSWDPCAGVKVHNIPSEGKKATITFGYDANQQPVSGTTCPTHYRIDWVKNNYSGTLYLPL